MRQYNLSKERLTELKEILEKDYKRELSMKEVNEAGQNLLNFEELIMEMYHRQKDEQND